VVVWRGAPSRKASGAWNPGGNPLTCTDAQGTVGGRSRGHSGRQGHRDGSKGRPAFKREQARNHREKPEEYSIFALHQIGACGT